MVFSFSGTYYPDDGGSELANCRECLPGFACEQFGTAVPTVPCAAGHYCTGGANTSQPVDMPFGDLCPPGKRVTDLKTSVQCV